jgi:hypothetical protein
MNEKDNLRSDWSKTILIGIGLLMIASAVTIGLFHGFSLRKLFVGLMGLLLLAAVRLGKRIVILHQNTAVILLNTLLLGIFLETAATAVLWFWERAEQARETRTDTNFNGDALQVSYAPYVIWKTKPYQGEDVNVDKDGNRVTPGARCNKDSYTVFMFGGSTMWGDGAPDWGTVPAYLQTQLSGLHKEPVCVRNFGQPAWVSTQSVIELLRHLQAGEVPNLVIFYDGINDVGMATGEGVAGGHESISRIASRFRKETATRSFFQLLAQTRTFELAERLLPSLSALRDWPSDYRKPTYNTEVLGHAITHAYLTNYRAVKALANDFGFDYAFFWQPNLAYEQKPLTDEEKQLLEGIRVERAAINKLLTVTYPEVRAATQDHDHLFYIADIFRDVTDRVYLNDAHLTPVGNQKVAKRMMELLVKA